jgi:protocatechuate 3,4-dioxygenase, beta subunit
MVPRHIFVGFRPRQSPLHLETAMPQPTPQLGRRRFILGGLAAAGGLITPANAQARARTPAQTEGPFYPTTMPADIDNDLVVVRGSAARAQGTVAHVMGRLVDVNGRPIQNAQIEIWQCDARGIYLHPRSAGSGGRDTAFQGFGRVVTDADGKYSFRTIRPVPYPGRTPHIHFAVATPDKRNLTTQMYIAGEPQNARDGLYRSLGRASDLVTVRFEAANGVEAGAIAGEFNIVI